MPDRCEKHFESVDPFNTVNTVAGIIFTDTTKYGDLRITSVNGEPTEQYIHATPKFYYPGRRESPRGVFTRDDFPDKQFRVYEKLDGTNIFMFTYKDARGNQFTSFKTRLTPFLRMDGFKDWISLWNRAVNDDPDTVHRFVNIHGGHAFELYGYLNEILVKYDVPLALRYLYTIKDDGWIVYLGKDDPVQVGHGNDDAATAYKQLVSIAESKFKDGKRAEGFMFYFDDGPVYKCKPTCVVEEQSDSPFIGSDDIHVTAMNAAESIDTIDELLGMTLVLLGEVYDEKKIERSRPRIEAVVGEARKYLLVQKEVVAVMKELGYTWSDENKATIMRAVMQRFPKSMSNMVYGMLSGRKRK